MKKSTKIILIIVSSLLIVASIITSIYFACKSKGQNANLYTIISGWISGVATFVIGLLTLWLTNKIDKESKRKDDMRDKELKEQYINQLKLSANPIIYFENIEKVSFDANNMLISNHEFVNRLLDKEIDKKVISSTAGLSFELVFKTPKAESVENIYVESIDLIVKDQDNFGQLYTHKFTNYSDNKKANLKYKDNGSLECHADLLLMDNYEDIFGHFDDVVGKNNQIVFMTELIASNSLGLSKKYKCAFYFNLVKKEVGELDFINYEIEMKDNVMWAEEVVVKLKN